MDDFLRWKTRFEEEKAHNLNSLMTPVCTSINSVNGAVVNSTTQNTSARLTIIGGVHQSTAASIYAAQPIDVTEE